MKKLKYERIILIILITTLIVYKVMTLLSTKTDDTVIENALNLTSKPLYTDIITLDIENLLSDSFSIDELKSISIEIYIPEYDYHYTYNESLELLNASTIKVPLNMYIYDLAKEDPNILAQELIYDDMFYEDGSGIMQSTEPGTAFDMQTLLTYSIMYSDNIATNMLLYEFINDIETCVELIPYWGEANYIDWSSTTNNKMIALKILYQNRESYKTLINDMINSVYKYRSPLYLPKQVTSAVKTGDVDLTIHDMMIVFDNAHTDYLIAISMNEVNDSDERMAILSKDIYYIITR